MGPEFLKEEKQKKSMGSSSSSHARNSQPNTNNTSNTRTQTGPRPIVGHPDTRTAMIPDHFTSVPQVTQALRQNGLESCNLILGIDFTKSNDWSGKRTFGGRSLHTIDEPGVMNPYEEVIETIGKTLRDFDDDNMIPVYGFGDELTGDHSVFTFATDEQLARQPSTSPVGFPLERIRSRYREIVPNAVMAGPTSFAPIINEAVKIVNQTGQYHILVIIADGQVTRSVDIPPHAVSKNEKETIDAITYASHFPLSIVMVGVGDGPWESMVYFDNYLMHRKFDNFQFVEFHKITSQCSSQPAAREAQFALQALMEIPDQYQTIKELKYLDRGSYNFATSLPEVEVYPAPRPLPPPSSMPATTYPTPYASYAAAPAYPQKPSAYASVPAPLVATEVSTNGASGPAPAPVPMLAGVPSAPPVFEEVTPPVATRPPLKSQLSAAELELSRLQEELLCGICEDRRKDTVFQCGHETCRTCADLLTHCPTCRQEIQVRIKRFG